MVGEDGRGGWWGRVVGEGDRGGWGGRGGEGYVQTGFLHEMSCAPILNCLCVSTSNKKIFQLYMF